MATIPRTGRGTADVDRETQVQAQTGRARRQFSLGEDALRRLADLQQRTGAASQSEVIRNALRVYDFLSEEESRGHRVLIEQDDKTFVQLKIL